MKTPDLTIAGAPKCGSTSLFHYLAAHPAVCAASRQETRYLIDRGYPLFNPAYNYFTNGIEGYARFFSHCDGENIGMKNLECTPDYLYQSTPLQVFTEMRPRPQMIFILREPASRCFSMFQYAKHNMALLDMGLSFEGFIDEIKIRKSSVLDNKPILKNAIEHSRYVKYLSKWKKVLGGNFLQIYLFEDLVNNPLKISKEVARHNGLDPGFYNDFSFEVKNPTIVAKSRHLHVLVRKLLPITHNRPFVRSVGRKFYSIWNRSAQKPIPTMQDKETICCLAEEFSTSNRELADLFGLDLSGWSLGN
jgi:hypothetical protein